MSGRRLKKKKFQKIHHVKLGNACITLQCLVKAIKIYLTDLDLPAIQLFHSGSGITMKFRRYERFYPDETEEKT